MNKTSPATCAVPSSSADLDSPVMLTSKIHSELKHSTNELLVFESNGKIGTSNVLFDTNEASPTCAVLSSSVDLGSPVMPHSLIHSELQHSTNKLLVLESNSTNDTSNALLDMDVDLASPICAVPSINIDLDSSVIQNSLIHSELPDSIIPMDKTLEGLQIDDSHTDDTITKEKDAGELDKIWKEELHFPEIKTSKRKTRSAKPKIFAITSEAWKKEQDEKSKKAEEQNRLKEFKKFEREVKKKIKEEEDEIKKQEKLKIKLLEESKKKEMQDKVNLLLKRKAASLYLKDVPSRITKRFLSYEEYN